MVTIEAESLSRLQAYNSQGESLVQGYSYTVCEANGDDFVIRVPKGKMIEFHLECFQILYGNPLNEDRDFVKKIQNFLETYSTLQELAPEIVNGIQRRLR